MGVFDDMAARFERAASLVPEIIDKSFEATEEQLLDLNRSQLEEGKKSDGQNITPKYTPEYAKRKKNSKSSPTPDLKITGAFYRSFNLAIKERTLEIQGDLKTNKGFALAEHLEKRYTSDIYGLTATNTKKYGRILLPVLQKSLSDEIGI